MAGLRALVKATACRVLCWARVPQLAHRRVCPDTLAIVMYHAVVSEPLPVPDWGFLGLDCFERQLRYLKQAFEVLPLAAALERLDRGRCGKPLAAITFDDGFRNNFTAAFPVLRRLELPATVYLSTAFVDSDRTLWFCRVNRAVAGTRLAEVTSAGRRFPLGTAGQRARAARALQRQLKTLPPAGIDEEVAALEQRLEVPVQPIGPESPYRMLGRGDIAAMQASGLVEFGAHTHTHAILTGLDEGRMRGEISRSVAAVGELTGQPCRHFAYPNGKFDAAATAALEAAGVRYAATTREGPVYPGAQRLSLRRYAVANDTGDAAFRLKVHHTRAALRGRDDR